MGIQVLLNNYLSKGHFRLDQVFPESTRQDLFKTSVKGGHLKQEASINFNLA